MIRNRIAVVLGGLSLLVISCKKDDDVVNRTTARYA